MYQKHAHSGSSVELWEENWQSAQFYQALEFCRIDPLRPLFEKYAKQGSLMLEGGCGMGQYVAFYTERGVKVVGLDFAQRALHQLNRRVSGLKLCAGNVAALPFADETFDVYYSGGVVEHFEGGAEKSLSEARRVLKKDGVLLISVPHFSPLRRVLSPLKKDVWRHVDKSETENRTENDLNFFQYAYKPTEFSKMLGNAGLEVIEKQGFAVLWGLSDLPLLGEKNEIQPTKNRQPTPELKEEKPNLSNVNQPVSVSLLKRLVIGEDASIPVLGFGVKFMSWAVSNMMMYVCIKKESKIN